MEPSLKAQGEQERVHQLEINADRDMSPLRFPQQTSVQTDLQQPPFDPFQRAEQRRDPFLPRRSSMRDSSTFNGRCHDPTADGQMLVAGAVLSNPQTIASHGLYNSDSGSHSTDGSPRIDTLDTAMSTPSNLLAQVSNDHRPHPLSYELTSLSRRGSVSAHDPDHGHISTSRDDANARIDRSSTAISIQSLVGNGSNGQSHDAPWSSYASRIVLPGSKRRRSTSPTRDTKINLTPEPWSVDNPSLARSDTFKRTPEGQTSSHMSPSAQQRHAQNDAGILRDQSLKSANVMVATISTNINEPPQAPYRLLPSFSNDMDGQNAETNNDDNNDEKDVVTERSGTINNTTCGKDYTSLTEETPSSTMLQVEETRAEQAHVQHSGSQLSHHHHNNLQSAYKPHQSQSDDVYAPHVHSSEPHQLPIDPSMDVSERVSNSESALEKPKRGQESSALKAWCESREKFTPSDRRSRHSPATHEPHLFGSIEDNQSRHGPLLGVPSDIGRRYDRSSPLPQAVQGAQRQPAGLGRDPGIKSEFGRMFSGLGSGVRSTPQPNLPAADTPVLNESRTSDDNRDQETTSKYAGSVSQAIKRKAEVAVDLGNEYVEEILNAPSPTHRAEYRRGDYTSNAMPHHHHHHHASGLHHHHHHHHHRRKRDEDQFKASLPRGSKIVSPGPVQTAANLRHHHHHSHHHHHHNPKHRADPTATLTIKMSPLLRSVMILPRRHLGFQLYRPHPALPSLTATYSTTSHMVDLVPNSLPRFNSGNVNSTITVRVSRDFLRSTAREQICASRRLWGTEIYTDDSDPVAAAVHCGMIRGAWNAEVDSNALLNVQSNDKDISEEFVTQSSRRDPELRKAEQSLPLVPPINCHAHITLLVLPPLEKYERAIRYGLKSRRWGSNHDGMSFKVERVEFVGGCETDSLLAIKGCG